ncbi:MAG: alpha/beta fold hydrolase [Gammaproteobacteria bacterium]
MSTTSAVTETRPPHSCTEDFLSFWKDTLKQLAGVSAEIHVINHEKTTDGLVVQRLTYQSLGQASIHGYLLTPRFSQGSGHCIPLIVYTHGYMSQCDVVWTWAKQGAAVFGIDVRGFGRSRDAVSRLSRHGYVLTGIESPFTSILRGAVCDYIRGIEVARKLLKDQSFKTILYGKSFGGALAAMGAALTHYADFLVAAVPTFSWMEGRRRLVTAGSGAEVNAYIDKHPEQEHHILQVLKYFDTMNFAPLIKCPALIGVGRQDPIVPAETVYAFYNHLSCNKQIREFPVSHSSSPEEKLWDNFETEWLQRAMSNEF